MNTPVKKDPFNRMWIVTNGIPIVKSYNGNITLRALHYQLVALGMTNDVTHYKKVVAAMIEARWDGLIGFDAFLDHERETLGQTNWEETDVPSGVSRAENQIRLWATSYRKNRWENQPVYPEVFIEKKALQGVFDKPCQDWNVALNPCKGYPSLTFLNNARGRFEDATNAGKHVVILYFGDYDCSGEDIPRSIADTLDKMGTPVEMKRIALMEQQVKQWKLPPAPTKTQDTRSHFWNGIGQVELDAVAPTKIVRLLTDALEDIFDPDLHDELLDQEIKEQKEFKEILKKDFPKLLK